MIVDLLRHGTTGRGEFMDGRTDRALSAEGWEQVERQTAGRSWRGIVTSPSRRARDAARRLADERTMIPRVDEDWAELDFGAWDGRRMADIAALPGGRAALDAFHADPARHAPPGGESWPDFEARVARALGRLLAEASSGPVLVVTHGGPMRLALSQTCGFDLRALWAVRIGYGARVRLDLNKGSDGAFWGEIVEIGQP